MRSSVLRPDRMSPVGRACTLPGSPTGTVYVGSAGGGGGGGGGGAGRGDGGSGWDAFRPLPRHGQGDDRGRGAAGGSRGDAGGHAALHGGEGRALALQLGARGTAAPRTSPRATQQGPRANMVKAGGALSRVAPPA